MCHVKILAVLIILTVVIEGGHCLPRKELSRKKRTSDQRLAELETLFALSKMNGKLVTIPIGFGKIDPSKLGRRKRSTDILLRQLTGHLAAEEKSSRESYRKMVESSKDGVGGDEHESKI